MWTSPEHKKYHKDLEHWKHCYWLISLANFGLQDYLKGLILFSIQHSSLSETFSHKAVDPAEMGMKSLKSAKLQCIKAPQIFKMELITHSHKNVQVLIMLSQKKMQHSVSEGCDSYCRTHCRIILGAAKPVGEAPAWVRLLWLHTALIKLLPGRHTKSNPSQHASRFTGQ